MLLQKGAGSYTTLIDVIEERNNYDYHRITYNIQILAHVLLTDPNKKDVGGCNALHLVCKASSDVNITEVVELLIERYFALLFTISSTTHVAMYTY